VPGALSPGIKRPGHEADNSPPSNTEVKNGEAIHPFLHMSAYIIFTSIIILPHLKIFKTNKYGL
jgi:hypothetical protein